jgi:hypothetical protein
MATRDVMPFFFFNDFSFSGVTHESREATVVVVPGKESQKNNNSKDTEENVK